MRHLVLGTAGHIDHGKSALVQALTGTDPDRLKEEKRRGITIELGFADLDLGDGRVLSVVDVPGHERFVRHMVAGASGIDAVLLVIAADQGVQPQTREHMGICTLLGLTRGVVALSKQDLVDPELREVVALEVGELLSDSFLRDAPIVPVSARTGEGLDDLRQALSNLFSRTSPRPQEGIPRLPVDRSFVLKGFGTVVTGTLAGSSLSEGDEVEVLPGGRRGRIRGLHVHHSRVASAAAGQRTAVNLQGLECAEVPRGSTLAVPGTLHSTQRAWARLALLDNAPKNLRRGGLVRFHQGTCERSGRFRVIGKAEDGSLCVDLFLGEPTPLAPGDRFILRRPAPVDTLGGGVIVDVRPPRRHPFDSMAFSDEALAPGFGLGLRLRRAGSAGREAAQLAPELGLTAAQLEAAGESLRAAGELVIAATGWFDGDTWRGLERRTLEKLEAFHEAEPLRQGISREELRARCDRAIPQEAWRQLLEALAGTGKIELAGDLVALAGHQVVLEGADFELSAELDRRFREAGLEPPQLEELVPAGQRARAAKLVALLVAEGRLTRIREGRLFHTAALDDLRARLREYAKRSKTIDVAAFKQLADVTRKNAIPLLEHLDAERFTRRVGNLREILGDELS